MLRALLGSTSRAPRQIYNAALGRTDDVHGKISPTAWLDGIRGYASLFVALFHMRFGYTDDVYIGYGSPPMDTRHTPNTSIWQLPLIRLLFAGKAMVAVFYVVSGISLAWGPLSNVHRGERDRSMARLRSQLFRRYFRLFLPVLGCTAVAMLATCLGFYQLGEALDTRLMNMESVPKRMPSLWLQMKDWLQESWLFCNVLSGAWAHSYYPASWSIVEEYRFSMLLLAAMAAMNQFRLLPRLLSWLVLLAYVFATGEGHVWSFFLGGTVCQLIVWRTLPRLQGGFPVAEKSWLRDCPWIACLMAGLWMISYPECYGEYAPGYGFLAFFSPKWDEPQWFWHSIGAGLVCIAAANNIHIQWFFSNSFARYLGRISFGLYLTHVIVMHVLSLWLLPLFHVLTGADGVGTVAWEAGFFLNLLVYVPTSCLAAGFFTRLVDAPSLRFSKWLEAKLSLDQSNTAYRPTVSYV